MKKLLSLLLGLSLFLGLGGLAMGQDETPAVENGVISVEAPPVVVVPAPAAPEVVIAPAPVEVDPVTVAAREYAASQEETIELRRQIESLKELLKSKEQGGAASKVALITAFENSSAPAQAWLLSPSRVLVVFSGPNGPVVTLVEPRK